MARTERFGLVLTKQERQGLQRLADKERLSASAVVRRLIWNALERLEAESDEVSSGAASLHVAEREEVQQ